MNSTPDNIQYWRNDIMMGLISRSKADNILKSAKNMGWEAYDNGSYICIYTEERK